MFQLAYDDKSTRRLGATPLCRRLSPVQRTHLFRVAEVYSYEALQSICRTISSVSDVGGMVFTLELGLQGQHNLAPHGSGRVNAGPPPLVTPADFATLLRRLPRLDTIFVRTFDTALCGVLLDEAASGPLASLRRLDIERDGNFVPVDNQGRDTVDWLQRLSQLPHLEDLALRQWDGGVAVLPASLNPPRFSHLKRLSLLADELPTWTHPVLVDMAPHVDDLELCDSDNVAWFASALATAPIELRKLVLRCEGAADGAATVSVHAVLARFPHLEHLEVCAGAFDPSLPTALPSLLGLAHLGTLVFSYDSVNDDFLLALLRNPQHLPHLARLDLSHSTSCRGWTVGRKGFLTEDDRPYNLCWPMWRGWTPPEYSLGCSEHVRRAVMQAAQARGIVVLGTALEALGWQTAFDAEQRFAVLAYGDATGDFEPARNVLGDDLVDELLDLSERAWLDGGEGGEGIEVDQSSEGGEGGGVRGARRDEVGEDLEEELEEVGRARSIFLSLRALVLSILSRETYRGLPQELALRLESCERLQRRALEQEQRAGLERRSSSSLFERPCCSSVEHLPATQEEPAWPSLMRSSTRAPTRAAAPPGAEERQQLSDSEQASAPVQQDSAADTDAQSCSSGRCAGGAKTVRSEREEAGSEAGGRRLRAARWQEREQAERDRVE